MTALPDAIETTKLLTTTLRRPVKVVALKKPGPDSELLACGHYLDGQKVLVAGCFADKPFINYAGAALSLIPADAAEDNLKQASLDEIVQENFAEVLNIFSRLFNLANKSRIVLSATEFPPAARSATSLAMLAHSAGRIDFDVTIDGYGKGRLVLALLPG